MIGKAVICTWVNDTHASMTNHPDTIQTNISYPLLGNHSLQPVTGFILWTYLYFDDG